jgi:hypothetical protein
VSLSKLDLVARHVDEPLDLFRIVRGAHVGAPGVLEAFRSNYERDAPPRGLEVESELMHLGLSMFVTFEAAEDVALLISDDAGNVVAGPIHAVPVPAR